MRSDCSRPSERLELQQIVTDDENLRGTTDCEALQAYLSGRCPRQKDASYAPVGSLSNLVAQVLAVAQNEHAQQMTAPCIRECGSLFTISNKICADQVSRSFLEGLRRIAESGFE
jgi:hypothetical protein